MIRRLTLCLWLAGALRLAGAEPLPLECKPLPSFDPADWKSVELAFKDATPVSMKEAWQQELDAGFKPAVVRTGWHGDSLWVYAELEDVSIANPTTRLNEVYDFPKDLKEDQWFDPLSSTRGDAFEIFLRKSTKEHYLEFHVTPQNHILQLRWKYAGDYMDNVREGGRQLRKRVIEGKQVIATYTRVDEKSQKWFVLAEIPSKLLDETGGIKPGDEWRFSFCRYDFTTGNKEPVLSSTSPHQERGFHRQQEWGYLKFSK